MNKQYISSSPSDTQELGIILAKSLKKGDLVILDGDLGSGKTCLVSGFLKHYGKETEIQSPTFTIVNEHNLKDDLTLFHFDVYRLEDEDEFLAIGGEEYFEKGITFMEWGMNIKNILPKEFLEIKITKDSSDLDKRIFEFIPHGEYYIELINKLNFDKVI